MHINLHLSKWPQNVFAKFANPPKMTVCKTVKYIIKIQDWWRKGFMLMNFFSTRHKNISFILRRSWLLIIQIIMHIMFFLSFRVILPINFFLLYLIWHLLTLHVHKVHRYQDRYLIKCQMIYRISSFTMWYCNKLQDMHFYFIFRKLGVLQIRRDKLKCNNHNTLFVFFCAQCKNMFQETV